MEQIYDVAVLGGGPGGYTAALYCARAGLSTVVLEKLSPGGQMATTSNVENYPGFAEGVDGFDLAMQMKDGAERFGVETLFAGRNGCGAGRRRENHHHLLRRAPGAHRHSGDRSRPASSGRAS